MTTTTTSTIAPAVADQVWTVQVEGVLSDDATAKVDDVTLESMVELMLRTQGVRTARATPGAEEPAVLTVQIGLLAPDATAALARARGLVQACAGYAGLRGVVPRRDQLVA